MARSPRSLRSLFVGRGLFDIAVWIAALLIAAVSLARAIRTGEGWVSASCSAVVAVAYTFKPWVGEGGRIQRARPPEGRGIADDRRLGRHARRRRDSRGRRLGGSRLGAHLHDQRGARRGGRVLRARRRGRQGMPGPARTSRCARTCSTCLQERLPGLDNDLVIRAMGSADDTYFTIWSRGAGAHRRCH